MRHFIFLILLAISQLAFAAPRQPNVILVMTDDQGYGDLGCHGNKLIRTPNIDKLHSESVRLTNYHVDPTCSPTRAALLTGRYSTRTGVWHTIMGRSLMARDEVTLGDVFAAGGYQTAMFGKWHLGDSYPLFPENRGFGEVIRHGGGGIIQTPDFWGNKYFDDTYWHNGKPTKYKGYCTDVFFDGALQFIEKNKDRPFFVYLPTNAAHGPFLVAQKYRKMYHEAGVKGTLANFWGMITNIDDNMGRLAKKLDELKLTENTILIFTTDNGTAVGSRHNAGMRGTKGSEYEGGHRVPFFVRWPAKLKGGRDVTRLTAHIDVLPTLVEMCLLKAPKGVHIDGVSLVPLLEGKKDLEWPDRTLLVHSQRVENPQKWRKSAVMTERWRLVNGRQLFDMQADPGQRKDVATANSAVVESLRSEYEKWYKSISTRFNEYVRIELGAAKGNPTSFTCHDWHGRSVPWHQGMIKRSPKANGFWAVEVMQDGKYEITLRGRPQQVGYVLKATRAKLKIGETMIEQPVTKGSTAVTFAVDLKAGKAKLQTWLIEPGGAQRGAFFVDVRRLDP
jgi:arylsulfatase A-like enzyme